MGHPSSASSDPELWDVSANSLAWIQNCGMLQQIRSLGFRTVGMSQLIRSLGSRIVGMSQLIRSLGSRIVGMSQLIRSLAFRIVRMSQLARSLGFRLVRMSQWSRTVGEQPCTLQDHICSHVRNNQPSPKSDVKVDCLDQTHDNCCPVRAKKTSLRDFVHSRLSNSPSPLGSKLARIGA